MHMHAGRRRVRAWDSDCENLPTTALMGRRRGSACVGLWTVTVTNQDESLVPAKIDFVLDVFVCCMYVC